MFSTRVPSSREPNRLSRAVRHARSGSLIDLTVSNPTRVGLDYPALLLQPLSGRAALAYDPQPFGSLEARHAVAMDYQRRALSAPPSRIVLTASTSEAYSLLFKLLCDPGDAVLVPVPSYPLFDHLTRLDGVRSVAYPLEYHGRWTIDMDTLLERAPDDARALLAVSPNNPTGSMLSTAEQGYLDAWCAARGAALIVDEVFADYPLHDDPMVACSASAAAALTFRLGGLSKSVGLPQVKLGWIAVDGPTALVDDALERLELICDTYLSVSTPVQVAAAALLEQGSAVRRQILERVRGNHGTLRALVARRPAVELLGAEGGWSAVLRVPSTRPEEDLVVDLVERDGVLVHPGFFFDFPQEAYLVLSLLPEPPLFEEGVTRLLDRADA